MNTILISGTVKNLYTTNDNETKHLCEYSVFIFGSKKGNALQFVRELNFTSEIGYSELWQRAKEIAVEYFSEGYMQDGAYTQFLDHLITLPQSSKKPSEIKGVKIGDKFRPNNAKHIVAEVVDFLELKSMVTSEITGYQCIAKNITGFARNTYEVTFTSVKRYAVT